jgi:hypothetical protein
MFSVLLLCPDRITARFMPCESTNDLKNPKKNSLPFFYTLLLPSRKSVFQNIQNILEVLCICAVLRLFSEIKWGPTGCFLSSAFSQKSSAKRRVLSGQTSDSKTLNSSLLTTFPHSYHDLLQSQCLKLYTMAQNVFWPPPLSQNPLRYHRCALSRPSTLETCGKQSYLLPPS